MHLCERVAVRRVQTGHGVGGVEGEVAGGSKDAWASRSNNWLKLVTCQL